MDKPNRKWTIMFLLAGDSLLASTMISQLKALKDAGYQKDTNVLAYFDPNCNGKNARVFDVNAVRRDQSTEGTFIGDGRNPFVRNIAEDSHDPGLPQIPAAVSLRYFLEYAKTYYPAENYLLFLMGHGMVVGNDAFLFDADDSSGITLAALGEILRGFSEKIRAENAEFHLVGFHSCCMSSIEVAYELRGTARFMMGTQGLAFPGSWPYRQLLKKIFGAIEDIAENDEPYPNKQVRAILNGLQHLSFYNSVDFELGGYPADLSMCSLDDDKISALDTQIKALARALRKGVAHKGTRNLIQLAHLESQSYYSENYTDLYDLCDRLQAYCQDRDEPQISIWTACKKLKQVLESNPGRRADKEGAFDRLVVFSDFHGASYQFSHGLSIFFPWRSPATRILANYQHYAFTRETGTDSWLSFLKEYFYETRRPVVGTNTKVDDRKLDTDASLLKLGSPPIYLTKSGKTVGTLDGPGPSDKATGTLDMFEPSDKASGTLDQFEPSDKTSGTLDQFEPSDKTSGTLDQFEPSDKTSGTLDQFEPSDKTSGSLNFSTIAKLLATLDPGPSDKASGSVGFFGLTVIKNYSAPEGVEITSRAKRNGNSAGKDRTPPRR